MARLSFQLLTWEVSFSLKPGGCESHRLPSGRMARAVEWSGSGCLEVLLPRMLCFHDVLGKKQETKAQHGSSHFPRKVCV